MRGRRGTMGRGYLHRGPLTLVPPHNYEGDPLGTQRSEAGVIRRGRREKIWRCGVRSADRSRAGIKAAGHADVVSHRSVVKRLDSHAIPLHRLGLVGVFRRGRRSGTPGWAPPLSGDGVAGFSALAKGGKMNEVTQSISLPLVTPLQRRKKEIQQRRLRASWGFSGPRLCHGCYARGGEAI